MSAAATYNTDATVPAPVASAGCDGLRGAYISFSFFQEDEDAWMEWMNSVFPTLCGFDHQESEFCFICRDIEAYESLVRKQDREFANQQYEAYNASLPGPEGDDHFERKFHGVLAREAKERKNRKNADRHHAKLQWREKRRIAREDPSSTPIGVKADRDPKARHHKRANARQRNGPNNNKAQRQRDVHNERYALVDGFIAEQDDWFTPDDFADEKSLHDLTREYLDEKTRLESSDL